MNRRFLAYLLATACADSGYWVSVVAGGWLVVKMTNSPLWLGLISAAAQLPFLLFSLAGGGLADRFDRRALVALANLAIAAVALVTATLVALGTITVGWLAVLGFAAGTLLALEHPVDRAWVYDLVAGERLGRAIALTSLEWATARTVGPAIGGTAIALVGIAAGYATYALLVVPLIVLALVLRARGAAVATATGRPATPASLRAIVAFSAFTAVFTIGITPYQALLPEIAKNGFGADATGYGTMAAAGGIGAILGALGLALRGESRRDGRIAIGAAFAGALLLFAFTRTHALLPAYALLVAMGTVDTLMYALANTYVQKIAGDDERGRANAIFSLAFLGGIPLGSALLGLLAGRFGSMTVLGWSAAAVASGAVAFWFAFPAARDAA